MFIPFWMIVSDSVGMGEAAIHTRFAKKRRAFREPAPTGVRAEILRTSWAALESNNDVSEVTRQKFYVKHIYTHADYDVANVWYARNKGVKR